MWSSLQIGLPELGTSVIYGILLCAAYTFAVAVAAGRSKPRLLQAARVGAYATSAMVGFAVLLLAYAFLTHDFRIRYVLRYSDRSMSTPYLLTSLWGGQDGSLLWWIALLSVYITLAIRWLKGRYRDLQPYVIATLMVIVAFFTIVLIFSANPFATTIASSPPDGEGLNPLLQSYWMIIHPPALYTGFVGCSVPFAFAIAALITGRLDNEWIIAVRKWMLFAFLFLSIGNWLGMMWAYEELGWGGYWAWDPVENAACLPWFTAAAYVHSTMIQERRSMLKVWNLFLICLTFFLTIFGTFLTRSGLITSVHSFAQSSIGNYFLVFMGLIIATSVGLIVWRLPELRAKSEIEAVTSREAMFVLNNWALLGAMSFIAIATLFPKISEWLWNENATVGPPFFNRWLAPIGLLIFALMGLAPLFGWRKTSPELLRKSFVWPLAALFAGAALHLALGKALGFPALVENDIFYPGAVGLVLQKIGAISPLLTMSLAAFNVAVIVQEFARGVAARQSAAQKRGEQESIGQALFRLVSKNRRRYGGYIVHAGIVCMFIGFAGAAWNVDREASLSVGETYTVGNYTVTYKSARMCPSMRPDGGGCSVEEQSDVSKRRVIANLELARGGKYVGSVSPAQFVYTRQQQTTTEVSILRTFRDDFYSVVGRVDPSTKQATFQFHVKPLVSWIWLGVTILIFGTTLSLWPQFSYGRVGVWSLVRTASGAATGIAFSIWLAMSPSLAHAKVRPRAVASPAAVQTEPARSSQMAIALALGAGLVVGVGQSLRRRRDLGE
ncbi:MAG: cytochrome c-type biogenesis CcmF C-terminal domain-containing protein [Polyangiaceae bacterium]|nr:cytochrome c-type biogenesis CcmF C-terminal domain-containing protein [Polyangiaceae bacterium]